MKRFLSKALRVCLPAVLIASVLIPSLLVSASIVQKQSHPQSFSQAVLPANADIVKAGGYLGIVTGAANWGNDAIARRMDFLLMNNEARIRQNGNIDHFVLYIANITDVTEFHLNIWRKDGATWDRIYDEDFVGSLSVSAALTLTPSTSWTVQEGDQVGATVITNGADGTYQMQAVASQAAGSSRFVINAAPADTNYDWSVQTANTGVVPIHVYMQAPQVVFTGDSIPAGHPAHYSGIENSTTWSLASSIEYQLSQLTSFTYQNMGIGSQTTTQIAARFTADVVNLKPRFAVIEGGVNDIGGGAITKATFLANWTTMLDACQTNSIIPVVVKILPWTNGTNGQMQTRDTWNADLVTLAQSYPTAIIVDTSSYIGLFRAGGDVGNLWDIQPAYDADGVHPNAAGLGEVAQAILDTNATVTTNAATGVTMDKDGVTGGAFNGTASPDNNAQFNYGLTVAYGSSTATAADTSGNLTTSIPTALTPGQTYHYRATAVSLDGTVNGTDQTFTFTLPTVTTQSSSNRTFNGNITNLGVATNTYGRFEYGLTAAYGYTTPLVTKSATGAFTASMPDTLIPGTTYHYRAKTSTGGVVSNGADSTFVFPYKSNINSSSSTARGTIPVLFIAILIVGLAGILIATENITLGIIIAAVAAIMIGLSILSAVQSALNSL